jgi:hypothetical protein
MNELLVVKWSTKSVFFNEIKFVNSEGLQYTHGLTSSAAAGFLTQLLAASSKYGIFFVGTNKGTGTLIDLI